jgi:hypothetical protein
MPSAAVIQNTFICLKWPNVVRRSARLKSIHSRTVLTVNFKASAAFSPGRVIQFVRVVRAMRRA